MALIFETDLRMVTAILERLPDSAAGKTCVFEPEDPKRAVGLNVLDGEDPDLVVDHVVSVFKRIYESAWGPRTDDIMRAACLTLSQVPGTTLAEVPLLLTNREWRAELRSQHHLLGHSRELATFWDWYEHLGEQNRAQNTAPLMNKIRAFTLRGPVQAVVGQARPKLDVEELVEEGGLLLVRIPKGTLGEDTSRLIGSFVVARVWQACMRRARRPEASRAPVTLYVDEMHSYLALPRSFEDMLAEARSYRLALVLAHQHMGQLDRAMREALGANARTKVAFTCSPDDAAVLEKHFRPYLTDYDLANLGRFQAACRPCIGGAHGPAFTLQSQPLGPGISGRAQAVREESGRRFAEPRARVEAAIAQRQGEIESRAREIVRRSAAQFAAQPPAQSPRRGSRAGCGVP
ncbi:MAG: type IV secretory system conjugative DNA transfer family protein [Actinomycetota bacterium]